MDQHVEAMTSGSEGIWLLLPRHGVDNDAEWGEHGFFSVSVLLPLFHDFVIRVSRGSQFRCLLPCFHLPSEVSLRITRRIR